MGGGYYDMDVARQTRTSPHQDAFSFQGYDYGSDQATSPRQGVHPILDPHGAHRECQNEVPIVIALDVTRSRGQDTHLVYEKLPMFIGQLELQGYVPGAALSFVAIGDAHAGDKAPLQVGQFEADNRLDEVLKSFWIEEGGGGTGQESYELAAYFFARHCTLASNAQGKKGFFFFVGDEGFYPEVSREQVAQLLGRELPKDLPSAQIFEELKQKFHVFFVYPKQSFAERRADIDAEIAQRVIAAGGQHDGVDIRASLLWNNRNDLDLHVICPSGERISFRNKRSQCGGWLDVDMNVNGETSKPVENIRWARGCAPKGRYEVRVQNFRFHERQQKPTPFKLELEVGGKVHHFQGDASPHGELQHDSELLVARFDFDPARQATPTPHHEEAYASYDDAVIRAQWERVLDEGHLLELSDPAALIDVVLGALALVGQDEPLERYVEGMARREQSSARQATVRQALGGLSSARGRARTQLVGELPKLAPRLGHDPGDAPTPSSSSQRL